MNATMTSKTVSMSAVQTLLAVAYGAYLAGRLSSPFIRRAWAVLDRLANHLFDAFCESFRSTVESPMDDALLADLDAAFDAAIDGYGIAPSDAQEADPMDDLIGAVARLLDHTQPVPEVDIPEVASEVASKPAKRRYSRKPKALPETLQTT